MTRMFYDNTPGLIDEWRRQNPQKRIGRPEELRGLVVWLASDASSYVNGSECVHRSFALAGVCDADGFPSKHHHRRRSHGVVRVYIANLKMGARTGEQKRSKAMRMISRRIKTCIIYSSKSRRKQCSLEV